MALQELTDAEVFGEEKPKELSDEEVFGEEKAPEPTAGGRASAAVGGVNRGIAGLAGLPVDTAENLYNLGKAAVGTAAIAAGKPELAPELTTGTPGGSRSIVALLNRLGINTENPQPGDPASRMLHTGGTIAGGSMVPGATPGSALAAAAGGAVAGEVLGPQYTGLGALAPAAAGQAAVGLKNLIANTAQPRFETFRQAGTTPSAGQVTDSAFLHGIENLAAKFPGGSGVMKSFIETQQRQMGARARTGVPAEAAGRAIEGGSANFLERTRAVYKHLENQMASKIPQGFSVPPTATVQALDDITRPTPGAENLTASMRNPKLIEMRDGLNLDLQKGQGQIPFQALREARSRVGSMIDDSMVSGAPNGELKKVYGALSQDMETAAKAAGAGPEFQRQNNYYRARMERIETVLERVVGKNKQPEDIFKAVNPTDPDQANKLRAVMRSLQPSERQIVSEAVANRLGRATPSNQNEIGDVFSSEKFLTNWNRLSPGAKAQLFPNPPLRENMEKIAKASDAIREGKGIYSNPSGTAGSFAAYAVYMGPIAAIGGGFGGFPGAAMASGSAAATAYVGAKMLTNPKVVEWLATPIRPNTPQAAAHLARLGVIYNEASPELKQELAQFVNSAQNLKMPQ